jgi:hypothetical protein
MINARFPTTVAVAADFETLPQSVWGIGGVKQK